MRQESLPQFTRGDLYQALCAAVRSYFVGMSRKNTIGAYFKAVLMMILATGCYVVYLEIPLATPALIGLSVVFGVALAGIAFNIQHDANHGAFARSRAMNRAAAFTLDIMGISSHVWRWKHNVFHHTFPNVEGADTDVDPRIFACFRPSQRRFWFHRYQHVYVWILYGFMVVRWHFLYDFLRLLSGRIGPHSLPRPRGIDLALFIAGKCCFFSLTFGLPLVFHPWPTVLLFYATTALTLGWICSLVFQLGHCFSDTSFRSSDNGATIDWALHQLSTTADFARASTLLTWYLGGLNFQIEHHLFPNLPHVHYQQIAPLVENACRQHGAPYVAHATFVAALRSHWQFLRRMSVDQESTSLGSEHQPESRGA